MIAQTLVAWAVDASHHCESSARGAHPAPLAVTEGPVRRYCTASVGPWLAAKRCRAGGLEALVQAWNQLQVASSTAPNCGWAKRRCSASCSSACPVHTHPVTLMTCVHQLHSCRSACPGHANTTISCLHTLTGPSWAKLRCRASCRSACPTHAAPHILGLACISWTQLDKRAGTVPPADPHAPHVHIPSCLCLHASGGLSWAREQAHCLLQNRM